MVCQLYRQVPGAVHDLVGRFGLDGVARVRRVIVLVKAVWVTVEFVLEIPAPGRGASAPGRVMRRVRLRRVSELGALAVVAVELL